MYVLKQRGMTLIDFLYHDKYIVICVKPVGVLSEPMAREKNLPVTYELFPNYKFFQFDNRTYLSVSNNASSLTPCTSVYDVKQAMQQYFSNFNSTLYDQAMSTNNQPWTTGTIHISNYVDTYYIIGEGFTTIKSINYIREDSTEIFELLTGEAGDGAVLSYSASINDMFAGRTYFSLATHNALVAEIKINQGSGPDDPDYISEISNNAAFVVGIVGGEIILTDWIYSNPDIVM